MKCLRNPTKHVKLLCLAHFDMPFPLRVAQRVAQGVTVNREFRYELSFKIQAIRHLRQKFGASPVIKQKYFLFMGQLLCLLSYALSVVVRKIGHVN